MGASYIVKHPFKFLPNTVFVAGSAWLGRAFIAFAQLISIPLLLKYLGPDHYSWLVVAMSLQGWWLLTDFGLALGLQNAISAQRVNQQSSHEVIINTAILILPVLLLCSALICTFSEELGGLLLPVAARQSGMAGFLVIWTGCLGLLMTMGNVAYRILYAQHLGYWANILPALGSMMTVIGLLLLPHLHVKQPLFWATIVWAGPSAALAALTFSLLLIRAIQKANHTVDRIVNIKICCQLLKQGSQFGLLAILGAFVLQIDYVVLGKVVASNEIVLYTIATKMVTFILFFFTAIVQAIWPLCAEAAAKHEWIKITIFMRRLLIMGFALVGFGCISMWLLRVQVLDYLASEQQLVLTLGLWLMLTLLALLRVWSDSFAMLLQSMNQVKIFLVYLPFQAALSLIGQIVFGQYYGVNGVVLASIVSFLCTSVWILPTVYRRFKFINMDGRYASA